jgi:hypothetical protein
VHLQLENFLHHQLHLSGSDAFLHHRVGGDVKMGLVQILLSSVDGVSYNIFVLGPQTLSQSLGLLDE